MSFLMRYVALLCVLVVGWCVGCAEQPQQPNAPQGAVATVDTGPPDDQLSLRSAHFVGVDACIDCHAERVESYKRTNHYATIRVPEPDNVVGDFDPPGNILRTRDPNLWFEMTRDGDDYYQTAVTRDAEGHEHRRTERVAFIVGSGKLNETYLYWRDDALFQLPITHMTAWNSWANSPGYTDGRAKFTRAIVPRCLECHATWFEHVPGTDNRYVKGREMLGISCEKCHGPASAHVTYHQRHPDLTESYHIVRPSEMTRQQENDQCAQCHGAVGEHLKPPFTYLPGDPLEDFLKPTEGRAAATFVHTANQIQHLSESPCYQQSGTLNCISCHDPHTPEPRDRAAYAGSCLNCHQAPDCGMHERMPEPVRGDCIDCHMPASRDITLQWFTAEDDFVHPTILTDHHIAVHPEAATRHLMQWHLSRDDEASQRAGRAMARTLAEDKRALARRLYDQGKHEASLETWREVLRLLGDDDEAAQRIDAIRAALVAERTRTETTIDAKLLITEGHELAVAGRMTEAAALFREAIALREDLAAGHQNLGNALAELGDVPGAITAMRRAVELEPAYAPNWFNLGNMYAADGRFERAAQAFERAAALDPTLAEAGRRHAIARRQADGGDRAFAHYRRALELQQQGDVETAMAHLRQALLLNDRLDKAHTMLGTLLWDLGKAQEAAGHFEAALAIEPGDPDALAGLARVRGQAP